MELCACTSHGLSNLPHYRLLNLNSIRFGFKPSLPLKKTIVPHRHRGLLYFGTHLLRATTSEETSTSKSRVSDGIMTTEEASEDDNNAQNKPELTEEVPKEEAPVGDQTQIFEFLDKLNLDSEDYSILLYGGVAVISAWLASAIVGAIDSIPVFPKLMEIVGLAYTIWFGSRYLIFKKNREELSAKIEELKQQVLGSNDD